MKISELRIGNQIKYHDKIITVAGVVRNTIYYESKGLCFDSNIGEYNPFQPIPLTEDLLLKFGFKKCRKYPYAFRIKLDKTYHLHFDLNFGAALSGKYKLSHYFNKSEDISFQILNGEINRIKYVHQLQNLYNTLTSKELIINQQKEDGI